MSNQSNNLLLLYILQCRSEDFIKRFEEQNNHCFIGVYSLYQLAYSNYLILSDDEWSQSAIPVIEICRKRCKEILLYLKNIIAVPTSFEYDLRKHLKCFAYYSEDYDFEFMLDGSLPHLLSLGYKEVDCKLYEAGMKLDYSEVERLLNIGANPNVWMSGDYNPEDAVKAGIDYAYCLTDDINTIVCDAVDVYGIYSYWEKGVRNEKQSVDIENLNFLFQGAAYQLMGMLISRKSLII